MNFYRFNELDSTNTYMRNNIENFEEFDVVIAKNQTQGRGRQGNTWISSEGMALFSFLFFEKKNIDLKEYTKLPLIVGISVLNALNNLENNNYKFKWTNDVYVNDKKISGVLIERKNNKFIIGIGINVNNEISENLKNIATKMNNYYEIDDVINEVIKIFKFYIEKFENGKWNEIIEEINRYNYLKNRNVEIKILDNILKAQVLDIAFDGRLRVLVDNEEKFYNVGEIIIKK